MYNLNESDRFQWVKTSGVQMTVSFSLQLLSQTATNTAQTTATTPPPEQKTPPSGDSSFATYLVVIVGLITAVALVMIYRNIRRATDWSLTEALSEEVPVGPIVKDAAGVPLQDSEGKIQHETVMKASSSRLIAFFGTIVIMMLYIGAGLAVLKNVAADGTIPQDTEKLTTFFASGMVLFAPYVVNKFSAIFSAPK